MKEITQQIIAIVVTLLNLRRSSNAGQWGKKIKPPKKDPVSLIPYKSSIGNLGYGVLPLPSLI